MAARKTTRRKASAKPCPDCTAGQTSETFKVGGRKKHESPDRQEALCLTCLGSGQISETP
ncbi:hypothetical protein BLA24_22485 [Streptomyces cinnamoneus]|uniref:Molecular chaperone DnaJ n=1 Tax=Streptomyces cinnamoneus TaxID=53446 RepID=A0A2G1XGR5_STRCJ|nr:hypothetical protein BLA24_22485 [Streptomyces cinnamoneus]PPT16427.1 hypothetical protein CYQ11_08305 [Streptomyces cinnamoneus]